MPRAPSSDPTPNDYPEQRHAGKVGYGPNYHAGASFGDVVNGLADEVKGKIKHDPDLIHHGQELISGEEKRKELLGETDTKHKKQKGPGLKESIIPRKPSKDEANVRDGAETSKVPPRAGSASRFTQAQHSSPNQSHYAQTSHISKHDPVH